MKRALFCITLTLVMAIAGIGQKNRTPDDAGANGKAKKPEKSLMLDSGTRLEGQLQNTLDAKNLQVGDQVALKTTHDLKTTGGTIVPKGSMLLGRITDVQQRTRSNADSRVGMVFDRLQSRGTTTPINASIVSITSAATSLQAGDTGADLFGSSSSSAGASSNGGGGGLLGGATGAVGGLLSTATQTTGTVVNTTGGLVNSAGQALGNTTGSVFKSINGITVSNSASGSAETTSSLSAQGKNVRVEKGANIQLRLNSSIGGN